MIGEVIYDVIDDYICLGYLGFLQEKLSKNNNNIEKTKFNDWSRLVIPEIFGNIMSFHRFFRSSISTFILTCRNALVPYYISKVFVTVEREVVGVDYIPITVKKNQCLSFTRRGDSSNIKSRYTINCQYIEKLIICKRCV